VKKIRTRSAISKQNRLGGAKAERDVRKWLIGLGFEVSQRQSQYRSGKVDGNELVVGGILAIEVKRHKDIGLGTKKLADACEQAKRDAKGKPWCVVWKNTGGKRFFLTVMSGSLSRITFDTDDGAASWIRTVLNQSKPSFFEDPQIGQMENAGTGAAA
jgi:Holliday junction resolvase